MWGSNEQQNQSLEHEMIGTISIHSRQGSKKHKSVCDELWDYGEDDEVIRSRAVNEKNINNVPEEIRSMREHPDPIPHEESAEYSSHLAFSQFHDENQSQPNSNKTLHKPKCPPNQNFHKLNQKQNIGTSPFSKHQINVHNPSATRTIDILTHRYISNMKLLTQQTKQLMAMWKYCIVENQREYYRKQLGKLESSCRKLRIGVRGIGDRKKKGIISYSKEKKLKTEHQEERKIGAEIVKQKKKNNQLSVRESLLNNYYHAIKTRSGFPRTPLKSNTKLKNTISFVEEDEVKIKQHCQLLKEKKKILQESLIESKAHIRKKYEQTLSENQLLHEEIQMIEEKIKRMPYNKGFSSIYTNRLLGRQDRTGMNGKSISKSSKKIQVRGQLSQTKRRYEGIKKTCISPRVKIGVEGQKQKKSQLTKVKSETYIVMDHENTRENDLIISNI